MNHFFEKEVQHRFSTLSSLQHYSVYNLVKRPDDCAPLTPTATGADQHQSTQVVHRLILATTTTASEQNYDDQQQRFVSGLEVYEYTTPSSNDAKPKRTIYISKIDTTGSTLARGVTRRLVQAYVATQQYVGGGCSIHVFARAQPQYLFPNSAKDTSKCILTDRQLVAWWRKTLSDKGLYSSTSTNASNSNIVTPFWIVPGVDEQGALYDIGQKRLLREANTIEWRYGYPYAGKALAKDVIPRFEDDGKARYLGTLLDSSASNDDQQNLTVDDFWSLFGYSEECGSGKLTAIFVIEISTTFTTTPCQVPTTAAIPAPLDDDEYTRIWNSLMALDFHDDPSNLDSTKTWLKTWHTIVSQRSFTIIPSSSASNNNSTNPANGTESGSETATPANGTAPRPIQILSIKRKPTSSSVQSPSNNMTITSSNSSNSSATTTVAPAVNVLVPKRRKKEN